jgi:hypothetical protein
VEGDEYLVRLTRCIHLNPVKIKACKQTNPDEKSALLAEWIWSSYRGYAGIGAAEDRVNYRWLELMGGASQNGNRALYRKYVTEMLAGTDEVLKEAGERSAHALGDESFQKEAEQTLEDQMQDKLFASDVTVRKKKSSVPEVEQVVLKAYGISRETLYSRRRAVAEAKGAALELCCRLTDISQRALSVRFGYGHESSVGKQRRAFAARLAEDQGLARRFNRLAHSMKS